MTGLGSDLLRLENRSASFRPRRIEPFLVTFICISCRMSSRTDTASQTCASLFSITHSARSLIAASVISALDGKPSFAKFSNT